MADSASVKAQINAWAASAKGRAAIKKKLEEYKKNGVENTQAGSIVLTDKRLLWLADRLCEEIIRAGSASGVPASVSGDIATIKRGAMKKNADGSRSVELSFSGDLSRPSLQPYEYPEGARNIIAIFNNGYPHNGTSPAAISSVFGEWNGRIVNARGSRSGLHFMQDAVSTFNKLYGEKYDVTVTLAEIYSDAG